MRKLLLVLLVLTSSFSIAMAQPATMTKGKIDSKSTKVDNKEVCQDKGTMDILDVEIITEYGETFQHPETELLCPFARWFMTNNEYSWYRWESTFMTGIIGEDPYIRYHVTSPGYIKVTVGDDNGNTGSDSIWFNIKPVYQMENFIMEIGDDHYPTFSGIVAPDHTMIIFERENYPGTAGYDQNPPISPGDWSWRDADAHYDENNLWLYLEILFDTCDYEPLVTRIPGLLLDTKEENDNWYLDMKTLIQTDNGYYYNNYGIEFVYFVYTVDGDGVRHHFIDETGQPVILPQDATTWQIPGPHADKEYQCGVAQITEDGYKLLSLSNKVENPLIDPTGLQEQTNSISIYPNPAQGRFTVKGTGGMTVSNLLGQVVLVKEIDGQTTVALPQGMYFVKLGNEIRKIVVE